MCSNTEFIPDIKCKPSSDAKNTLVIHGDMVYINLIYIGNVIERGVDYVKVRRKSTNIYMDDFEQVISLKTE